MSMKKFICLLSIVLLGSACHSVRPDAGQEGVIVRKPIIFGHGGVSNIPVTAGRKFVALTTDYILVDMRPVQSHVTFDDLMSKDGVPLDFDAVIRLQVTDSVRLINEFGGEWFSTNVTSEFQNRVRQAVRKHGMNETAINTSAIESIDQEVTESMVSYIKDAGLPIRLIQVTVGKANPPESIKHQRIETATHEQRSNTERQKKLAEDQRRDAEASRATADNAYRNALGMSTDQFIQLEQVKMLRDVCVGGKCTFLMGSGVTPVMNVR